MPAVADAVEAVVGTVQRALARLGPIGNSTRQDIEVPQVEAGLAPVRDPRREQTSTPWAFSSMGTRLTPAEMPKGVQRLAIRLT
jgi:hypothetical protein